ncbi:SDR family NAD(P)-dependent oxidoreductase [Solibacillus sp. NPDC093137]|uniref:SDR family NAD(P)-dependent oxidoreductase n=1 Tax=Solibacillus sp. NPDC093137 TaxID=3390678 RepID=UPI003D0464DB
MGRLKNKVAIITGAGSGIGKATALRFSEEGANVVCADLRGAEEIANEIKQLGGSAIAVETDISSSESWTNLLNKTLQEFGEVNILCNIAGIPEVGTKIVDLTEENFEKIINVNLKGVYLGMKAVLPEMEKNGSGKIINLASISAHIGVDGAPSYTAAKGGVSSMSRQVAIEYANKNIQVNAVSPGIINTGMAAASPEMTKALIDLTPVGRLGEPREIAHTLLFLASNESDFITGQTLKVDGGWSSK